MIINAFNQLGNTVTFTASTSAPTPVQAPTNTGLGSTQYEVLNAGLVTVFLGVGTSAANATNNAVVVTTTAASYPLLPGTDKIITAPPGAYFTGITVTGNAAIYITPGEGM
jgi:hypothetical protein